MSSEYFVKATEHALDVHYSTDAGVFVQRVERGHTFEFVGTYLGSTVPSDEPVPSAEGGAGNGYTTPVTPEPEAPAAPVVAEPEPEAEPEVPAPKKRGRKSNAEKAAEAEASKEADGDAA